MCKSTSLKDFTKRGLVCLINDTFKMHAGSEIDTTSARILNIINSKASPLLSLSRESLEQKARAIKKPNCSWSYYHCYIEKDNKKEFSLYSRSEIEDYVIERLSLKSSSNTAYKRFPTVDDAKEFLGKNNIPTMTGAEMIRKMSEHQVIKFAEFLYYM